MTSAPAVPGSSQAEQRGAQQAAAEVLLEGPPQLQAVGVQEDIHGAILLPDVDGGERGPAGSAMSNGKKACLARPGRGTGS